MTCGSRRHRRRYGTAGSTFNGSHPAVLRVDPAGHPYAWLAWKDAVHYYSLGQVAWTVGDPSSVVLGGIGRDGEQTVLELHPVIAVRGTNASRLLTRVPALDKQILLARDRHTCLYCGERFPERHLTQDHVTPRSQGGGDTWTNLVAACKACNHRKANRTPEQAHMPLLAVPYEPNHAEALILAGRHILADQMEFLRALVPAGRRDRYLV